MSKNEEQESISNESSGGRYKRLAEHEIQAMESLTGRLGNLEQEQASTRSDIKSLFSMMQGVQTETREGMARVSDKLEKMTDRSRPNTLALFGALFGALALIATFGAMAFTPVYRTLADIKLQDRVSSEAVAKINSTRFTPDDARAQRMHLEGVIEDLSRDVSDRSYRNEELLLKLIERTAKLEGSIYQPHEHN